MEFELATVVFIGLACFVVGCWTGSRHRPANDFSSYQVGYMLGFRNGCLIGPPRFIGEEDELGPATSAGPRSLEFADSGPGSCR